MWWFVYIFRFSEFWVDSPDSDRRDLSMLVQQYIQNYLPAGQEGMKLVSSLVDFYIEAKRMSVTDLFDGADHRIHFSIRTLSRFVIVQSNMIGLFRMHLLLRLLMGLNGLYMRVLS
jgi:midasin (ATPase involved in ribosome maturation)